MLAVVKTPRTKKKFVVEGDIPNKLLVFLEKNFGKYLTIDNDDDDEYVNFRDTAWYKKMKKSWTPGKSVRVYRMRDQLTQAQLGRKLGGLSIQKISDIENNRRGISKELAKKLATLFGTSVDRFI